MKLTFVIQEIGVLALLMIIGFFVTKKEILNEKTSEGMIRVLTDIALPALIISSFNFSYSQDIIKELIIVFIYSFGIHIINIIIAEVLFNKFEIEKRRILKFGIIFGNSGFMGLPLILKLFGQEGILYASIFMIPYYILLLTYGEKILIGENTCLSLKNISKNSILPIIVIGTFIFILKIELPYIISKPLTILASLTTPLSMLIIGEKMTKLKFKEIIADKEIYYGCFVRLIVLPLITFILMTAISTPVLLKRILVIMQSLPTAILLVVFTEKHDGDIEFALKITVASHIASIITIPIIIFSTCMLK